jgi:hypothetical protein
MLGFEPMHAYRFVRYRVSGGGLRKGHSV